MWPSEFIPRFTAPQPDSDDPLHFAFIGDDILLTAENLIPPALQLTPLGDPLAAFIFGHLAEKPCLARRWAQDTPVPAGLQAVNLRTAFSFLPDGHWALAARAKQMQGWDLSSRYCGACGSATEFMDGEPAKLCPACGLRVYPQIAPAVMCLVTRGKELLLARSPHFRPGVYSALAGFVETGETVESCLHREVFEETGIRITNLRWFASQPWPFPNSLMLAFHADYAGGSITPQPGEIEDAQWFGLDSLPELPSPVSIAWRLLQDGIAQIKAR